MHPHGVLYNKSSEGAPYMDGEVWKMWRRWKTASHAKLCLSSTGTWGEDKADDAVPPGGNHTYVWEVRAR